MNKFAKTYIEEYRFHNYKDTSVITLVNIIL